MNTGEDLPSPDENWEWRANKIGKDKIIIDPRSFSFSPEKVVFNIAVFGFRSDINRFRLSVRCQSVRKRIVLEDNLEESPQIDGLACFEYPVKKIGESFLSLEVSNLKDLEVYISTNIKYPCAEKFKWAYGNVDTEGIKGNSL